MNQMLQTVRVGLFFVLGLALIYVVYSVIGARQMSKNDGYKLIAEYNDVKTVTRGADVRLAGVRIGEVDSTRLADGKGQIILKIQSDVSIPSDSVASIAMASLLGQSYIRLSYGEESATLKDGDQILTESTADFNDILVQIGDLGEKLNKIADGFSGLGGEGMGDLMGNLNSLVTDNREAVDKIVQNLETITTQLTGTEGTLGRLINDPSAYDELMATFEEIRGAATDARSTLANAGSIFDRLESGQGTLGKLLYDDKLSAELDQTVQNLRAFSEKLNSGEGTLGKLVTDDELYRDLRNMLNKADKALDSVGDSGPLTAAGALGGALF